METKHERRSQKTQIRATSDGSNRTLEGRAASYNVISSMLYEPQIGEFYEILLPGAFSEAIEDDCTCNIDHCDTELLGRTPKTLTLTDRDDGLYFSCRLPDTVAGNKAFVHCADDREDIRSCSFAFDVLDEEWSTTEDGCPLRQVKKVKLYDVAIVIRPAYPETSLSVRSLDLAKLVTKQAPVEQVVAEFGGSDPHRFRKMLLNLAEKT
jgi:HK97 family phage prohead protease